MTEPALAVRVRLGALWGAANVLLSRLLQFVTTAIVARLVAPEHFGALAVALAVQMIAMNASELGATAGLARGHRDPDEIAPTVYSIALATSTALTGLMIWTAPWVARMMGDPSATGVIRVLSLTVLLGGVSSVPSAMMWRDFQQKRRLAVDLANVVATTALVIPMALAGWGAMALAWSRVGGQVVAMIMFILLSTRRYWPGFSRGEARELLRLGIPLALANIVVFATLNLDYVVIGHHLGPVRLGLYLLAFNLAALPSNVFTQILRTVAVPTFGRMHQANQLSRNLPQAFALVGYVTFPVSALLVGLAGQLMVTLYGSAWTGGGPALMWLGVFAAGRTLTELLADLCLAVGRTGSLLWIQLVWIAALLPAMLFGVREWNIAGAGVAHSAVVWLVVVPVYTVVILRAVGARGGPVLLALIRPALASIVCGCAAWLVAHEVGTVVRLPLAGLVAGGIAGAAGYAALAYPGVRALRQTFSSPAALEEPPAGDDLTSDDQLTSDDLTSAVGNGVRTP